MILDESQARAILEECAERLEELGTGRLEYVLLALHTMAVGLAERQAFQLARVLG